MATPSDPQPPTSAAPFVPTTNSLHALAEASHGCRGCPLWQNTNGAVFGVGAGTSIMLVGEQPGDQEDRKGIPFVGPAGRVLWQCVEDAEIDREGLYVTNAVKHFKHEQRGKRRLHKKPTADEIDACHPWLDAEIRVIAPTVIVLLGATAARSALGRTVRIAASRGTRFDVAGVPTVVTYHPSAVLRADERSFDLRVAIVDDLRLAHRWSKE